MEILKDYNDNMSDEQCNKLMENWSESELVDFLCPNGVISIEELRNYVYKITED